MLKTLFYKDAYLREFTSKVTECLEGKNGYEVILEETAFYPEGGGQPGDQGFLNDEPVIDTKEKDGKILHICHKPVEEGTMVNGKLDWNRRFRHMQQHTGEHILSGIIHRKYGYENVGFHMGKDFVSVDFNGALTKEQIREIEMETNEAVFANLPVQIFYPDKNELETLSYRSKKELSGTIRIVQIPGIDICACCGTHVKQTGEVGLVKITGNENYKGGTRLILQIGFQAMEDYDRKQKAVQTVSVLLSAKPEMIGEAVEKQIHMVNEQKQQIVSLKQQLFHEKAKAIPEEICKICMVTKELSTADIRVLCEILLEKRKMAAVICEAESKGYQYVLGMQEGNIAELGHELLAACSGKGGGKGNMVQGTLFCTRKDIYSFFEDKQFVIIEE